MNRRNRFRRWMITFAAVAAVIIGISVSAPECTYAADTADENLGQYIPVAEYMSARTQTFPSASEDHPVYIRLCNMVNYPNFYEGTTDIYINSPETTLSFKQAGSYNELYYFYRYDNDKSNNHRIFRGTIPDAPHVSGVYISGGKGTRYDPYLLQWRYSRSGVYTLFELQPYDTLNGFLITEKNDTSITVKGRPVESYSGDHYLAVYRDASPDFYRIRPDEAITVNDLTPSTRIEISNNKTILPVLHVNDTEAGTEPEYSVTGNLGGGSVTCYYNAETSDKNAEGWTEWTEDNKPDAPGVYSAYAKVDATSFFNEAESEVITFEIYEGNAPQLTLPDPDHVFFHGVSYDNGYTQTMTFAGASEASPVYVKVSSYFYPANTPNFSVREIRHPEVAIKHIKAGSFEEIYFNDNDDDYRVQLLKGDGRSGKCGLSITGGKGTRRDPFILSWNWELSGRKNVKDVNQYDKLNGFQISKKTDDTITFKGKGDAGYHITVIRDRGFEYLPMPQTGEISIPDVTPLTMIQISNDRNFKPELRIEDTPYGETIVPAVTKNPGQGAVTVYFNTATGDKNAAGWSEWTETEKPETTGTYYVYAVVEATELFNKATTPVTSFEIEKAQYPAPAAPPQAKIIYEDTIELEEIEGCEYRLDGVSQWQKTGVFEDLEPNTEYTFYQRMARDKNHTPSEATSAVISTSDHAWSVVDYKWDYHVTSMTMTVTASRTCTRCGLAENENAEISVKLTREPTCVSRGEHTYTATFENPAFEQQVRVFDEVPATGHKLGESYKEDEIEPTCTEPGSYYQVTRCTVCNTVLRRVYTIEPARGHDWSEWESVQTTPGELIDKRTCNRCGEEEQVKTIEGEVHDMVRIAGSEPTCTESGIMEHVKCMGCGRLYTDLDAHTELTSDDIILPALGHSEGDMFVENEVAATCTDEGSCDEVICCRLCGQVLSRNTRTSEALGHDWTEAEYTWNGTDSVTAAHTCSRCDFDEEETAPASSNVTREPSCAQKGETTYTAAFENPAFAPQEKTLENIDATGHDWGEANYKWAEDKSIVTALRKCSKCHENDMDIAFVTNEVTKEPTSREAGERTYSAVFKDPFETQIRKETIPVDLDGAEIILSKTAFTYNNKVQKPEIKTIGGMTLKEGTDYTVRWSDASSMKAGSYTVSITGKGDYTGTTQAAYKIDRAANPLKIKGRTATVKYSKLKKKPQALKVTKVITFTKKGQGTMQYKLSSAKKGTRSFKKKFKVNAKSGKLTVAKGLAKGTYKVKVKAKAAGSENYKASAWKTVTFKIKVK